MRPFHSAFNTSSDRLHPLLQLPVLIISTVVWSWMRCCCGAQVRFAAVGCARSMWQYSSPTERRIPCSKFFTCHRRGVRL